MFFSPLFSPVENPFSLQALCSIDTEAGSILLLYVILSLIFDITIECRGYFLTILNSTKSQEPFLLGLFSRMKLPVVSGLYNNHRSWLCLNSWMYCFLNTLSCSSLSLIIPRDFHTQTLSIMKRLQGNRHSPSCSLSSFVMAEQPIASFTAITPFYYDLLPSLYEKKPKTFYRHHIDASPTESIVTTTTSSTNDPKQNLNHVINSIQKTLGTIHRLYLTVSSFNVSSQLPLR